MSDIKGITKPALTRLARKAGVKSMSEECTPLLQKILSNRLEELLKTMIICSKNKNNKTLLIDDLYNALEWDGINICRG